MVMMILSVSSGSGRQRRREAAECGLRMCRPAGFWAQAAVDIMGCKTEVIDETMMVQAAEKDINDMTEVLE